MDITEIVTTEFETVDANTRAAKLASQLQSAASRAVIVTDADGEYRGVVTLRQLGKTHRDPDTKVKRFLWHPATVKRGADVRDVARAMVASRSDVLPVFDGEKLYGVVTSDAVLEAVKDFLGVLTVEDVYTSDLVTVDSETTLGETLHEFRTNGVTHLPVVDDGDAVGVVSLYDFLDFTTRTVERSSGGSPGGFDAHGGAGSHAGYRTHGGFGERAGDIDRLLDLPVGDVMTEPVEVTTRSESLDDAVETMLTAGVSSLVVQEDSSPVGIVTTTDVLESLTWTDERRTPVQITNIDLLDDTTQADVTEMIEDITRKYRNLTLLDAKVHLHKHEEKLRGTPLIMARIRLFTDKGHFLGTGEGYGARHALSLAANAVERQVLGAKSHDETKKPPDEEYWERVFGWWLTAPPRRR
jgi:CBS domain-containing protein